MHGQAARIKRNSAFFFLSQLIRLFANFFLFVGIARFYGVEAFGQFTTAQAFSTVYLLFADFGFDILMTSEIARNREEAPRLVQTFFSVKVIFAAVSSLVMFAAAHFQHVSDATRLMMYIFSVYVFASSLGNFFYAMFRGFEEFYHETRISFTVNSALLVAVFLMGILKSPPWLAAAAFVGSRLLALALALGVASRMVPVRRLSYRFLEKSHFAVVTVYGLHAICGNLFFIQDTILLSMWRGDRDVGIYQSVFKLISVIFLISDVVSSTLLPVLSRLYSSDQVQWQRVGRLMNKTLFLVSIPITVLLFVYADQIIGLVYGGKAFDAAVPILRIFAFNVFFSFSPVTFAIMLTAGNRHRHRMYIVLLATVFNFLVNFFAIPAYGPIGAAWVSLITVVLVGTAYTVAMGPLLIRWVRSTEYIIPFVLGGILFAIFWEVRSLSFWFTLPIALVLFGILIYFGGYTAEERSLVFRTRDLMGAVR